MRLTTKGRFAVTAMLDLAMRQSEGPVALASISERQQISLSYLEQLFGKLRRRQLVLSVRGPGGGYRLAKGAAEINVAEVVVAVDEPLYATLCGGKGKCVLHGDQQHCMTHELWENLTIKMLEYLGSVSMQDLIDRNQKNAKKVSKPRNSRNCSPVPLRPRTPNSVFALADMPLR